MSSLWWKKSLNITRRSCKLFCGKLISWWKFFWPLFSHYIQLFGTEAPTETERQRAKGAHSTQYLVRNGWLVGQRRAGFFFKERARFFQWAQFAPFIRDLKTLQRIIMVKYYQSLQLKVGRFFLFLSHFLNLNICIQWIVYFIRLIDNTLSIWYIIRINTVISSINKAVGRSENQGWWGK